MDSISNLPKEIDDFLNNLPSDVREALEVMMIQRINSMKDAGLRDIVARPLNIEFLDGFCFCYNLLNKT